MRYAMFTFFMIYLFLLLTDSHHRAVSAQSSGEPPPPRGTLNTTCTPGTGGTTHKPTATQLQHAATHW